MLMSNKGRLARLHYLPGTYRVLVPGDHVVCAVTLQPISLADLKYWSVERQGALRFGRCLAESRRQGLIALATPREQPDLFVQASEAWRQGRSEAAAQLLRPWSRRSRGTPRR
jgi:hypothetical protein